MRLPKGIAAPLAAGAAMAAHDKIGLGAAVRSGPRLIMKSYLVNDQDGTQGLRLPKGMAALLAAGDASPRSLE